MNPVLHQQGAHYSATDIGPIDSWKGHTAEIAALPGVKVPGKFFLHPVLGLTGMEVSVNCLPAGAKVPFYHTHQAHEELYLFIKGRGQFQIDGEIVEIREGTSLRIAPPGERTWRNNSQEDLYYIVVQAVQASLASAGTEDGVPLQRRVTWPA